MFRNVLIVLAAVFYSHAVTASLLTPITDPGTGAKVYVPSGSGLGQSRTFTSSVNIGSGTAKVPTTLVKNFGWGRVGTAVRTIAKGSPQAIIGTAALAYLIEKIPGASISQGGLYKIPAPQTNPTTVIYWTAERADGSALSTRFGGTGDACRALSNYPYIYLSGTNDPNRYECHGTYSNGSSGPLLGYLQKATYTCDYGIDANKACLPPPSVSNDPVPFADADYDALSTNVPNIPSDMWGDFGPALDSIPGTFDQPDTTDFTGPPSVDLPSVTTTSTNATTGDVTVTQSLPSVTLSYSPSPLSVSATPTTTTNTYSNGTLQNTTTTTTNNTQNSNVTVSPPSTEVPTDCAFMPTVCEFIEWVKTPFEPDDIDFAQFTEDKDFTESITISGNASCPAPMVLNTGLGDFDFRWEPACQWAGMLKPILIIGALLAAIYISLGIGRSD